MKTHTIISASIPCDLYTTFKQVCHRSDVKKSRIITHLIAQAVKLPVSELKKIDSDIKTRIIRW